MIITFVGHGTLSISPELSAEIKKAIVNHEYGGAYKALKYAQRKLKRIINLSNT
jgi:hypothetical protein